MKVLAINFSPRKNGNCNRILKFCLKQYEMDDATTELLNLTDERIEPCGGCDYDCFRGDCVKIDGCMRIYDKMREADLILNAIPTFSGHLSSLYFSFSERGQGMYSKEGYDEDQILRKVNLIIVGNTSSGGDMALHEALYVFNNRIYYPETLLLSSREYDCRSTSGNLVDHDEIQSRLIRFCNRIKAKYRDCHR